ncbi:MAG: Ppx/GppA family phosphatase [Proteobacteria bacterium]|nr:Ppx/GppA family phosphatase [Pseudomonadota bacterium]
MIVGELRHGQLTIIDRLREPVRLAEGLTEDGQLAKAARQRAVDCLSRFGERLRDMHAASIRAAATNALRRARDSQKFMAEAETALGHPIEVISGIEEARLIYNGVTHSLPPYEGLRLVLDIGGGSTELILGRGAKPKALESLALGCVAMTEQHFENGKISEHAFEEARLAASLELRPVKAFFRDSPDIQSIGTSGTIIATAAVAHELGIIDSNELTSEDVETLIQKVLEFKNISALSLPGLSECRAQVWPGGLSILVELLRVLRIDKLGISDGALREGLLYDHLGRLQHEDARERSVRAMVSRYNVDEAQAKRVAHSAAELLSQCAKPWKLKFPLAAQLLDWASRLHEIGLDISHEGYQRHGAYIAENADLPGFPRAEQSILAFLIANQRRQIDTGSCLKIPSAWRERSLRLALLLRLAVLLNRSRTTVELPTIVLEVGQDDIRLKFPDAWLADNPLTVADLEREQEYLGYAGFSLDFA